MPTPRLDSITIRGFKSIASVENLALGPINIIIGPNGSGKSNFIGVFSFLREIRAGRLQNFILNAGGAEKVLHFGSKITDKIQIGISFEGGVHRYEISLNPTSGDRLHPNKENVVFLDKESMYATRGFEAGISDPTWKSAPDYVRQHLDQWRLYHFNDTSDSSPMKKTPALNDNQYLRSDGSNLAAFLYYLRAKHETAYDLIRRSVRRVAPFFEDFQLQPNKLNPDTIRLEWRHKNSEAYFDASSLSDGTLRFMALATLFLQPEQYRSSVILVDEPELGLHPFAITLLASLIKQSSTVAQVILGTQSPQLLDHFLPEDVLVANRVRGSSQLTRLDSGRLSSWLEDYSLGQLWEKNELEGRPAQE